MKKSLPNDPSDELQHNYEGQMSDDDANALELMIVQMNLATEKASKALDNALKFVIESNRRIDILEGRDNSISRKQLN